MVYFIGRHAFGLDTLISNPELVQTSVWDLIQMIRVRGHLQPLKGPWPNISLDLYYPVSREEFDELGVDEIDPDDKVSTTADPPPVPPHMPRKDDGNEKEEDMLPLLSAR